MALSQYDIRFILSMSDRTGNTLRRFAGDMRGATADAARMKKAFTAMDIGRGLQLRGLLGGAAMGAAASQAATFASSVTKAATQVAGDNSVQQTAKNTIALQEQILGLMHQFPASAQEQADAAYDIFSAMNVPLTKGVALLKLFNMVAVAGATDLETATDAMITVINNFGGTFDQVMKNVNTSFAIIRFGKLEFADFNNMLNSVVPAAKGAGQSLQDVSGAMAFLTTRMKPNIAATALSRLLEVMARPDFRRGAHRLGLEFTNLDGSLRPFPELINQLARLPVAQIKGAVNSLIPLVTAVGRGKGQGIQAQIQSRRALVAMVTDTKGLADAQRNVAGATDEFRKRYIAMIGSAGVRWERFKAQLQATAIVVGAAVIPWFERLGEVVTRGVDWAKQNRGTVEFIAKAVLAVSVASLLAGTFLKLYGASLILYTGLLRLGKAFAFASLMTRLGAAAGFLGAAFSLLRSNGLKALPVIFMNLAALSKLAKLGIITTTIIVLWEVHKTKGWNEFWKSVDEKVLGATDFVKKHGGPAGMAMASGVEAVINLDKKTRIKNLAELKAKAKQGKGSNKDIADTVGNNYKSLIADIKRNIKEVGGGIFDAKMFKDLGLDPKSIQDQINKLLYPEAGGKGGEAAQRAAQFAKDVAARTKELLTQASDALMQIYDGFKQTNQQAFGSIFEPIEGTGEEEQLRKAWNWTGGANNLLQTMKARLAQFKQWRGMLGMLLRKGFSKDFVEEFKKMGPEGLKHLDELKKAGPKRVQEFNTIMAQGKGAVTKATEIDFNTQLAKWNKFGKDTAFKIITGMESEEQGVQKRMNAVVERLYGGIAQEIARQQVKLEMTVPDAKVTFDYSGLKARPETGTTEQPGQPDRGPRPTGRGRIPFWWREDVAAQRPGGPRMAPAPQRPFETTAAYERMTGAVPGAAGKYPVTSYTFNVNGTFLSHQEMMDTALRQAAHKTKHKR